LGTGGADAGAVPGSSAFLHERLRAVFPGTLPLREWQECLAGFPALSPVLVHGDVHEDQIFVENSGSLRIADPGSGAGPVGHLAWDFDFGE